jgi:hypothetical protein
MMAVKDVSMTEASTALTAPPAPRGNGSWVRALVTTAALAAGVMLALVAAFVALVGVLAAVAVLLVRRRRTPDGPVTLEGRRTPDGWVAEAASR